MNNNPTTYDFPHLPTPRGITLSAIQVTTPDGRTWSIEMQADARFRLFELTGDDDEAEEHDAIDGEGWCASDLLDYLAAVGQPPTSDTNSTAS